MRQLRAFALRVFGLLSGRMAGHDLDAGLDSHIDHHVAECMRGGMPEHEARLLRGD